MDAHLCFTLQKSGVGGGGVGPRKTARRFIGTCCSLYVLLCHPQMTVFLEVPCGPICSGHHTGVPGREEEGKRVNYAPLPKKASPQGKLGSGCPGPSFPTKTKILY